LRGFRIELGEIETIIGQHPRVKQNVVIVREDQPGNKMLVAYVVSKDGSDITTNELRSFVGEKLPQYMTPTIFVMMEVLPLTPNGKINRRALPKPDASLFISEKTFVEPANETEERLVKIWKELLKVPQISVT